MAVKNYGIRDQWTNLDKLNNVDIKSVDGVIESVKINGEEAGGGGGSSDFSTAEVTLIVSDDFQSLINIWTPSMVDEPDFACAINNLQAEPGQTNTQSVILYKGMAIGTLLLGDFDPAPTINVLGNVTYEGAGAFTITGDCTITIS